MSRNCCRYVRYGLANDIYRPILLSYNGKIDVRICICGAEESVSANATETYQRHSSLVSPLLLLL